MVIVPVILHLEPFCKCIHKTQAESTNQSQNASTTAVQLNLTLSEL